MKPLIPEHIDALCSYCQRTLQPVFEASLEGERGKENVLDYITREKLTSKDTARNACDLWR